MDWKQRRKKESEKLLLNIKNVSEILHGLGIVSAELHYQGGGDSGCYGTTVVVTGEGDDEVRWQSREGRGEAEGEQDPDDAELDSYTWPAGQVAVWAYDWSKKDFVDQMKTLPDALDFVLEKAIETSHAGWENNEGGLGSVTLVTAEGLINVHHGYYVKHVEWTDSCIGGAEIEPEEVPAAESTDLAEGEE